MFRTTTNMQSVSDALSKSSSVMMFLTSMVFAGILYSFTSVLKGKTSKKKPELSRLEFLEMHFSSDAEDSTSGPLSRGGITNRFTFYETSISNLPKIMRAKFLRIERLFYFLNISKCVTFNNSFATITSL